MRHAREDYNHIQDPSGKIPDDEPVFLIRGQDMCAIPAMRAWAGAAYAVGADEYIIDVVDGWIEEVRKYQEQNGSKIPDL